MTRAVVGEADAIVLWRQSYYDSKARHTTTTTPTTTSMLLFCTVVVSSLSLLCSYNCGELMRDFLWMHYNNNHSNHDSSLLTTLWVFSMPTLLLLAASTTAVSLTRGSTKMQRVDVVNLWTLQIVQQHCLLFLIIQLWGAVLLLDGFERLLPEQLLRSSPSEIFLVTSLTQSVQMAMLAERVVALQQKHMSAFLPVSRAGLAVTHVALRGAYCMTALGLIKTVFF